MQGFVLRQNIAKHHHKIWAGVMLIVCAGWASTYIDLRKAETAGGYAQQWWAASHTALQYTYEHDHNPLSEEFSVAREHMLAEARANPEGALHLLQASRMAGDLALHHQLVKEIANVSSQGRLAEIGNWLLEELDQTSAMVKVSTKADGLLTMEQRKKLDDCYNRAKQGQYNQVAFRAQIYGIPDMTKPANCQL